MFRIKTVALSDKSDSNTQNPCIKTALEVVKVKRITVRCPYCGAKATKHPATYVYGDHTVAKYDVYVCDRYPACDSYVAAHEKTGLPMGSLANSELRHKRILAHKAFDKLWKSELMTKAQAYRWMQMALGLPDKYAHIAMFNEYRCEQLIQVCSLITRSTCHSVA